jgi:hypothetical protein
MSLTNVKRSLTRGELAREPRSLAVVAYFDGYTQAAYPNAHRHEYPRPLLRSEARSWHEGFAEGRAERSRLEAHGFASCESIDCEGVHR